MRVFDTIYVDGLGHEVGCTMPIFDHERSESEQSFQYLHRKAVSQAVCPLTANERQDKQRSVHASRDHFGDVAQR